MCENVTVIAPLNEDGICKVYKQLNQLRDESVADVMKSYGMDVIRICGSELAEIEAVEEDLGLILEHQSEVDTEEFETLIDEISLCLHQLGWNYDGWVGEDVEVVREYH